MGRANFPLARPEGPRKRGQVCGWLAFIYLWLACAPALLAQEGSGTPDAIAIKVDAGGFSLASEWPLGVGVPLPEGRFRSVEAIRLKGERQGLIPTQVTEKTKWRDGSLQWIWVDFLGNPSDRYALHLRGFGSRRPEVKRPLTVTQDDRTLRVDTGSMCVTWKKSQASPTIVEIRPSVRIVGDGEGIYVVDRRGRQGVLGGKGADLSWTVEMAGPLRAIVKVEGWYVTPGGDRLARAVVRYHLYSGGRFFTLDHTFIFTEDTDELWFREVGVRFPWQGCDSTRVRFGVKGAAEICSEIRGSSDHAWIFQDDYPHFAQTRKHFSFGMNERLLKEGEEIEGWCEVSDFNSGITVAIQDMARQFPKELCGDRQGVTARLWSNRGGKELDYRPATLMDDYYGKDWFGAMKKGPVQGEMVPCDAEGFRQLNPSALGSARTHFLLCAYHAGTPEPRISARLAGAFERPPVALADPAWLCTSGALWRVAPKDTVRFAKAEQFISEFFDLWLSRMKDFPMSGWIGRGVGPELSYERRADGKTYASFYRLNNVAAYHTPRNVWVAYYRSGDRKYLDFAEPYTRFLADFTVLHWGGGREKKEKGLIVVGLGPFPLYWAGPGYWETRGASTDYLVPHRLAYFLRDCRWARDCLELYADAMNRLWNLDDCRTFNAPFTHLSMMLNAYLVTQDPRLAEKLRLLADALVDLKDPLGFSTSFYTRKLEFPYDATYKYERKVLALLDYYDAFGDEKIKKAILKANAELFAMSSQCCPVAYQNYMPVHLARCFEWTGNRDYAAVAAAHLDSALDWFEEFKATPSDRQHLASFTPDKQGFPFFSVPYVLTMLSSPKYGPHTFPYLANLGRDEECSIYFVKERGREASLLVSINVGLAEPVRIRGGAKAAGEFRYDPSRIAPVVNPRVIGPNGKEMTECIKEEPMHHANVFRVTIPAPAAQGVYRVSFGNNRFLVIGANVEKLVLYLPKGTYLGHREHLGYALTRNKPYYFQAPSGQGSFAVRVSHPVRLFDPSGREYEEARGRTGRITVTNAKPGLWSFLPGQAAYVQLEGLVPVVGFGEKSRFFLPPGVKQTELETDWEPPAQEGLVDGRFGKGLHITGRAFRAQCGELAAEFPYPQGTMEFFFRPDWSSRWLPESDPAPLCAVPPLYLTYRHQPQRDGSDSFYTWLQFHPVWEKSGLGWITRAEAYASFSAGQWNHLACTWQVDPPKYVIFHNGQRVGELPDPYRYQRAALAIPRRQGDGTLALGPWAGTYDEFRLSRTVRYKKDFDVPERPFVEDSDTVLLFHLDQNLAASGKPREVKFGPE